jgi:hypothetical protein
MTLFDAGCRALSHQKIRVTPRTPRDGNLVPDITNNDMLDMRGIVPPATL